MDCGGVASVYFPPVMSTVTEIKEAVRKLPPRKKLELVNWMQTQVGGDATMIVAGEGARAHDRHEATHAKRMSKEESVEARRFLSYFDKAVKTIATGVRPTGSIVATLGKMRR